MAQVEGSYYVPHGSRWPIVGSIGMFVMLASAASWMNGSSFAEWTFWLGMATIIFMVFGWFGTVIRESQQNLYNEQVGVSFRMGMVWFIFSEVMFFAAFFGAAAVTAATETDPAPIAAFTPDLSAPFAKISVTRIKVSF